MGAGSIRGVVSDYQRGFDDALDVAFGLLEKFEGVALRREIDKMRKLRQEDRVERVLAEFFP